jgi:glucose-1-phosphate adenylyltransferase
MEHVIAVVMAGGMGERLQPLTQVRAKPAVPFGGIYRIVDFTLSNCINSGIRRILVLTQYKSHSLSSHLKLGWSFLSRRVGQYVEEVPAQMQLGEQWYKGTADAIRQNMLFIKEASPSHVLVLSGDHIYKMDYRRLLRHHEEKGACLTVSVVRVEVDEARNTYGVLEVDQNGRIVGFEEKPANPKPIPGTTMCLASMGIYAFDQECLEKQLDNDLTDFGKDIIPAMIRRGEDVYAFDFTVDNDIEEYEHIMQEGLRVKRRVDRASDSDYWRDVGTLESFWLANLDLVAPKPRFNLYGELWPVFSCPQHFPPAKFVHESPGRTGIAVRSIIADGVIVSGSTIRSCILGSGIYVHSYSLVESSVLMGGTMSAGILNETVIGRGCRIRNAVIDKNVKVSAGAELGYDREADARRGLKVQPLSRGNEHLVVVPKDTVI